MPCPHNEITIVQRSQQQSAVAAAAYQSGEKLFCEYDQKVKHYPEKRGIVHNEILLPANAPRSYADRNTLWNARNAEVPGICQIVGLSKTSASIWQRPKGAPLLSKRACNKLVMRLRRFWMGRA